MSVESIIAAQQTFATNALTSADAVLNKLDNLADSSFSAQSNALLPGYTLDASHLAALQALLTALFPNALSVADISATAPTFTPDTVDDLPDVTIPVFDK